MTALRSALSHAAALSWIGFVVAGSWAFVAWMTVDMHHPWIMLMMPPSVGHWRMDTTVAVFLMWAIMMVAMMLPSAAPVLLAFDQLERKRSPGDRQARTTLAFAAGYIAVWIGFAMAATTLQWMLLRLGLITAMVKSASPWLTTAVLAMAGAYQLSPWKDACLNSCRTPMGFLLTEWRPGYRGAWRMGVKHGVYCVGCCSEAMELEDSVHRLVRRCWHSQFATDLDYMAS
jgi:predicted metal-binding membrane protein